ncbi:MAG: hypothetical protein Q4B50_08350, partial [Bacillota bacterium]|nr:hypothetical protein [Bacillota bacterium]
MKWMRYFLYLSIVLCMLLCLPACGWMDDLRSYKQGPEEAAVPEEQSPSPPESSIVEQRLGLADPPLLPEEAAATASPPEAASNASAETKE